MAQPSPEDQVRFLLNVQRLLNEGAFTASYKFAMLLGLADLSVEVGDDSGASLTVAIERIAEKFIGYYWRHAVPYVGGGSGSVLQQNMKGQAEVIGHILAARREHGDSLLALQRKPRAWRSLLLKVASVFWGQPLWRLQRVGDGVLEFLYDNRDLGTKVETIELKPGVAYCLRRFYPLITHLVRSAWIDYIRRVRANAAVLGSTTDLSAFLFGSERSDLGVLRPMLADLQAGRCFYCGRDGGASDVDHFVPWSRYPVDLGHNFVLAHAKCNGSKGSMLAAEEHLAKWAERNRTFGDQIAAECNGREFPHTLAGSTQIAIWAYEQAFAAGSLTWAGGKRLVPLAQTWRERIAPARPL